MQIGTDGFFHLTYCTNIHPGERWDEVFRNLDVYTRALKTRLSPDEPFGIGLRLSDLASREILEGDELPRFKDWLDANGMYVFTMNGFPYGGFHRQIVKDHVYAPDWRTQERVDYTVRLAHILAELLPEGMEGGISTSPISYKPWLATGERHEALELGAIHLEQVTAELVRLRERTDKLIHIDIEPEPDCLIENLAETIHFFNDVLLPKSGNMLIVDDLQDHIRVCYDTCHFAVEYEQPDVVFEQFAENGIKVGKVQISSALRIPIPQSEEGRHEVVELLDPFAEHTYLHQVIERRPGGTLGHYSDLPRAVYNILDAEAEEWRIHYHVPIFVDHYGKLGSTQYDITATLDEVIPQRICSHFEIETYTWDVLPPELKVDITESISREYEWVLEQFDKRMREGKEGQ